MSAIDAIAAQIGSAIPVLHGQSAFSDILKGKREINSRHAKAFAARFGVSPAAFV